MQNYLVQSDLHSLELLCRRLCIHARNPNAIDKLSRKPSSKTSVILPAINTFLISVQFQYTDVSKQIVFFL